MSRVSLDAKRLAACIERIALDAHLDGRVYTKGGEKRTPAEEYERMVRQARNTFCMYFPRAKELPHVE